MHGIASPIWRGLWRLCTRRSHDGEEALLQALPNEPLHEDARECEAQDDRRVHLQPRHES